MKVASIAINERGFIGRTQREMLDWCRAKCLELKSQNPDIIIFPETVFIMYAENEPLPFDEFYYIAVKEMCETAKEISSYILINLHEPHESENDLRHISTIMINKNGEIAGKYRKMYPVDSEIRNSNIVPGNAPCVVDTEFGKIGIATCFDIGWRPFWQTMADMGAKAVIWTSAYDGGNMLDAYAVMHMYWVISSVRTYHSRIIDPVGRTVAESARWDNVCLADIDLDIEVFHIDNQINLIHKVREALGDRVVIETRSEENVFTISSRDPEWPMDRIKKEFGLVSYKEYHAAAELLQNEWRDRYTK